LPGESVCVSGIVYKASGLPELLGQDIAVTLAVHPFATQDWDGNGKIDQPTAQTPTLDSYLEWQNWLNAGEPMPGPGMLWTTAGDGYGTLLGGPSAVFDNGINIQPAPSPGE
jgi:hypothetical protein